MDLEAAKDEARAAAEVPAMLERLAERVGAGARATAIFGDPIERGEITVVPVAKAAWGFGGGGGGEGPEQGSGGGGGGSVKPLGYLEVRDTDARFVPLRGTTARAVIAGVGGTLLGAAASALLRRR